LLAHTLVLHYFVPSSMLENSLGMGGGAKGSLLRSLGPCEHEHKKTLVTNTIDNSAFVRTQHSDL